MIDGRSRVCLYFVIAVFGVSEGLVPPDIYASIVWAILLSTVISPLLLKTTLAFFPYYIDITMTTIDDEENINDNGNGISNKSKEEEDASVVKIIEWNVVTTNHNNYNKSDDEMKRRS